MGYKKHFSSVLFSKKTNNLFDEVFIKSGRDFNFDFLFKGNPE